MLEPLHPTSANTKAILLQVNLIYMGFLLAVRTDVELPRAIELVDPPAADTFRSRLLAVGGGAACRFGARRARLAPGVDGAVALVFRFAAGALPPAVVAAADDRPACGGG